MPLEVSEYPLSAQATEHFAQVLRDDPAEAAKLAAARDDGDSRLMQAIFNARPVALLLLHRDGDNWRPDSLVVHPATRGRGVGSSLLREAAVRLPLTLPDACRPLADKAGLDHS